MGPVKRKTERHAPEPRLLTPAERQDLELELERIVGRLSEMLPGYYSPPFEECAGTASTTAHEKVVCEMAHLEERRDWIARCLELGIWNGPNFERPINAGER